MDNEELDDVVSEFHNASQEANTVIDEEEAVTWKKAKKNISSKRLDRNVS